jgi:hypothetical protein
MMAGVIFRFDNLQPRISVQARALRRRPCPLELPGSIGWRDGVEGGAG